MFYQFATQPAKRLSAWDRLNAFDSAALSPKASHGYIPGLDGLRAFAVLIVIIAHFGLAHIVPGGFGVTVFFFISGFLITRLLISEKETKGRVALKKFYIRRMIRLYPALVFMVVGTTIAYSALGFGGPTGLEFTAAMGYFTNIFQVLTRADGSLPFMPWTHLWSLAVEEHFYLIFPLILMACGLKWNRLQHALVACLVLVPVWRLITYLYLPVPVEDYNYMMTDARIDGIVWGCLFTVILHKEASLERLRRLIGFIPLIIAALAILASFIYREDSFRYVWRYSLQGAAIFVLLLNFFYLKALRFSIVLCEWHPLAWIGKTSYGLYLWHYPVYDLAQRTLGNTLTSLLLTILGSLIMTAFSFYIVEKSFLKLRAKFGSIKPTPIAPISLNPSQPVEWTKNFENLSVRP